MKRTSLDSALFGQIRAYLRAHVWKHGRAGTAEAFGVSRHTLWRFLDRGQVGRSLPHAVTGQVGATAGALAAATRGLDAEVQSLLAGIWQANAYGTANFQLGDFNAQSQVFHRNPA